MAVVYIVCLHRRLIHKRGMLRRTEWRRLLQLQRSSILQGRWCASLINKARDKLKSLGEGQVTLAKDEASGIATVTLVNELKKNALSGNMMVQLADITEELRPWTRGKGVILRGEGDTFSSGADLTTAGAIGNPGDGLLMSTFMHDTLSGLHRLPLVTVSLVHGLAIGGGAELATVTDYRLFSGSGEMCFVQCRMGVATGWGGGTRLVRLLGPGAALDLLATCRRVNADEALEVGLADGAVGVPDRYEETKAWLGARTSHETEVIQAMKKIVVGARDLNFDDSLRNERLIFSPLWGGPANKKAISKIMKRT